MTTDESAALWAVWEYLCTLEGEAGWSARLAWSIQMVWVLAAEEEKANG